MITAKALPIIIASITSTYVYSESVIQSILSRDYQMIPGQALQLRKIRPNDSNEIFNFLGVLERQNDMPARRAEKASAASLAGAFNPED